MNTQQVDGFFDLQVNGYAEVDFNADGLTAERLHHACLRLRQDGVAGMLAAFVTDELERMAGRMSALAALRAQDELARQVIAGLHVEGPFINEADGFRGAHPREAVRPADEQAMGRLLDAGGGLVRVVTLAPERDAGLKVTRRLVRQGIVVAAGHCDPSLDQLAEALDAGLSMFTHLGNGCPMQIPRHENVIQRALSLRGRLWLGFIADGQHIPPYALGNYLRSAGTERAFVVSDATGSSGCDRAYHQIGRWKVPLGPDRVARSPDGAFLLGSTATLRQCRDVLVGPAGLTAEQATLLTSANPRRAIGLT